MNSYPFNDADEPMCSGDQYRRDCEEIAERLGVYSFLTQPVMDLYNEDPESGPRIPALCSWVVTQCDDFLRRIEDTVDSNRGQWALNRFAGYFFWSQHDRCAEDDVDYMDRSIRGYLPTYTEPWDDVVYARLDEYKTTREAVDHILTLAEDISEHLMSHVLCQGDEDSQIPFVLDGDEPFVSSELMLAVRLLPAYDWDTEAVADAAPWILYLQDEITTLWTSLHFAIERGNAAVARETARQMARTGNRELAYRKGMGVYD